jgi:hypothetical protein
MPFLTGEPAVRQDGDRTWKLLEPIEYQGKHETFRVSAGFETDFASVPRLVTWLVPTYGRYTKAAILHDYLCTESHLGRFDRADADGIFRRAMRELNVGFLRRWLMWVAVRFGGGWKNFWKPNALFGVGVLLLGLVAAGFLVVPVVVVFAWSLAFWFLEWLVYVPLRVFGKSPKKAPDAKQVNAPKGLRGT